MSRPVKVCCFCETWESGGIESFLYNVLTRLDLTQIQVDIVAASMRKSVFSEPLLQRGIRFYELSGEQRNLIQNHRLFRKVLHTQRYDVIHLNIFHGLSLYYAYLAKRAGVPVRIAHSHNTALRKSAGRPVKLLLHKAAKRLFTSSATELWACSTPAAEFLFSPKVLSQKGFQFTPNGIDTGRFRFRPEVRKAVRAQLGLEGIAVLGNVGRLCAQKNQVFLLEIFAEVVRRNPESRLLLVGEGEDRRRLEEQADALGVAGKVIFYGVCEQVERLLWAMDTFLFPSRFEGLGIAAVEAQAAGLPVISSEFVPVEAQVTPLFQTLYLSAGPAAWANRALGAHAEKDRALYADEVKRAGFDISDGVEQIKASFLKTEI